MDGQRSRHRDSRRSALRLPAHVLPKRHRFCLGIHDSTCGRAKFRGGSVLNPPSLLCRKNSGDQYGTGRWNEYYRVAPSTTWPRLFPGLQPGEANYRGPTAEWKISCRSNRVWTERGKRFGEYRRGWSVTEWSRHGTHAKQFDQREC